MSLVWSTHTADFGEQFDRLISPLTREEFLGKYWGKSFARLNGPGGRFASILSWDQLNAMLEYHRLGPQQIELVHDGKPVDRKRFFEFPAGRAPRLKSAGLVSALSEGATLVVDNVDALVPSVRQIAEAVEHVLRASTTVNLYAGWRTQKGFDLHWDEQDTLILQVSGRKQWKVYQPTREHPLEHDAETAPAPTAPPVWDSVLEDGDALYLPRGWWHVATPLNEPSLHLTVTIVPANGLDLMRWMAERLKRHTEVRQNVPHLASDEDRRAYARRLRDLVAAEWTDEIVDRFLEEWQSQIPMRPVVHLPKAPIDQSAPIALDTRVRLAAARHLVFEEPHGDGPRYFHACGVRFECAPDLVPALAMLSGTDSHAVSELVDRVGDAAVTRLLTLLTALAMVGAVWTARH